VRSRSPLACAQALSATANAAANAALLSVHPQLRVDAESAAQVRLRSCRSAPHERRRGTSA
jgi:hypothetical protein